MKVKIMRTLTCLLTLSVAVPATTGNVRGDEPRARPASEIYCGVTLEWLADSCPYIGIYTVETAQADFSGHIHVGASLTETLRGKPPEKSHFDDPGFHEPGTKTSFPEKGDRYLIFFRDDRTSAGKNEIRKEHIIRLKRPNTKGWNLTAIRPDFSVLKDGTQVEKVVRDRISKVAVTPFPWYKRPTDRRRVEVPRDTPAFKALWDGENKAFLIIPYDLLPSASETQSPSTEEYDK